MSELKAFRDQFIEKVSQTLVLSEEKVELMLAAWFCRKNILLEGPPGTGKTTLCKILGSYSNSFKRVQMTSDVSPSDIIGFEVMKKGEQFQLEFQKGPVFSELLMVDEVNRAMPKTQSALLEAMQEKQVSLAGERHVLDQNFMVIATRNPFDMDGTFLMPASQRDRFSLCLSFEYARGEELKKLLRLNLENEKEVNEINAKLQAPVYKNDLHIDEEWLRVITELQESMKQEESLSEQSPRAFLDWIELASCLSKLRGEEHLSTKCLEVLLNPVFIHRLDPFEKEEAMKKLTDLFLKSIGR